jgi:two-component system LytT family sensor kinase
MPEAITQQQRDEFIRLLTRRTVYHSIFWVIILVFLSTLESLTTQESFSFVFSNQLVSLSVYALMVYFNLYYLIPNYLTQKRFITYVGLVFLVILTLTPLKTLIFYWKFTGRPDDQALLLSNLNFYFIPSFLVITASTILKIISDWFRNLRDQQELEAQTMQSELRFLRSQINPHFLFNTLNNIYALTLQKSDLAPDTVIKLSEMMRYMLYECNEKQVLLSKEIQYLRNYLDLEKLRLSHAIEVNFEVQGRVSDQKIAPLMFLPFLENSFKHGVMRTISRGYVNFRLLVDGNQLHMYLENSKPEKLPMPDRHRPSGGIGLVNVRRRLELLYPGRYSLHLEDAPTAYSVLLDLDLSEMKTFSSTS